MAALIAWTLVVRVDDLVKDGAKRRRLRRSAILDKIANTNRVPSKRSRPLSGPSLRWAMLPRLRIARTMADFVPTHRLTHEASQKMIAAGVAKANELGCKVSLAVVDQSCRLIAFLMMDGARHFSIITTQRKAITAASQRLPTGYAPEENALSMTVRMGDFTNVPGGFPIEVNGEVIGAVAAGGAKIEQDVEVAKAALTALQV
jgi:glc operon protein GlcG